MKVFLVNPRTINKENIPLGLAYVGASLKEAGHEVVIANMCDPIMASVGEDELLKEIKYYCPDFIGMYLCLAAIPEAYNLAKKISTLGIPRIAGGPHAHLLPDEVLNNHFDIVVRGEGEQTILDVLNGDISLEDINGISYKDASHKVQNNPIKYLDNLDATPIPAREIVNRNFKYLPNHIDNSYISNRFTITTSRGCPYNCSFCVSSGVSGKRYRFRSPENVLREIKFAKEKYGITRVHFTDDSPTVSRERMVKLCDPLIKGDLKVKWGCSSNLNLVTKELMVKMRDAGCDILSFGIESCDPETLRKTRKPLTVEGIYRGIKATIDAGIDFKFNLILGFPWETEKNINNSINLVKAIRAMPKSQRFRISAVHPIPFPGSQLYEEYHKQYGFTNWWLGKRRKNSNELMLFRKLYHRGRLPFFADRYIFLHKDYFKHTHYFWNYPVNFERVLRKNRSYCEIVNSIGWGRYPPWKAYLEYYLAVISGKLYSLHPDLEYFVFKTFLPRIYRIIKMFKGGKK